jgi:hypothetical protein
MNRHRNYFLAGILLIILISFSCKNHKLKNGRNKADLEIKRFESDLFSISLYHLQDSLPILQSQYPRFFPLFTNRIINIGDISQAGFNDRMIAFVSDFTIYNVNKTVQTVFADFKPIQNELSFVFGNYLNLFPGRSVPEIVTCISGFNQSIVVADNLLVISLDKYLGSNNEFYKLLYPPVPEYARYTMHPAKIPSDVAISFISTEFPYNDSKDNLISRMIFEGRAMYVAHALMSDINDSLFWGFTPGQLKFCRNNEKQMWTFLIENKYLFNSDKLLIIKFIEQAPFTKDFSKESPGRAALWLGYNIVESFMNNNKDTSFEQLMKETDYLKILNMSKYNP